MEDKIEILDIENKIVTTGYGPSPRKRWSGCSERAILLKVNETIQKGSLKLIMIRETFKNGASYKYVLKLEKTNLTKDKNYKKIRRKILNAINNRLKDLKCTQLHELFYRC